MDALCSGDLFQASGRQTSLRVATAQDRERRVLLETIANFHMLGAIQGSVLAAALAMRRQNSLANKLLSVWIALLSIDLISEFLMEKQFYLAFPHIIGATHSFPLFYGPLFFLYTRTLISTNPSLPGRQLLHFLPFLLHQLYFVPSFYVQSGAFKLQFMQDMMDQGPPAFIPVSTALKILHGFIYVVATLLLLRTHARAVRDSFSNLGEVSLSWLHVLTALQVAIWGTALAVNLLEYLGVALAAELSDGPIYVVAGVMVYVIGFFALRQPEIFLQGTQPAADAPTDVSPEASAPQKYEKTRLDEDKAQQYLQDLLDHMEEERPFIRSTLTLQELSDELSIASHQLSQVINDRLQKNFFDFINGYRVKEVQTRLLAPEAQNLTILAVALDSGFSSKSSFNTIFKKHTQMTPSQFKRSSGD
jgi:AraC-like DNA-binding protein